MLTLRKFAVIIQQRNKATRVCFLLLISRIHFSDRDSSNINGSFLDNTCQDLPGVRVSKRVDLPSMVVRMRLKLYALVLPDPLSRRTIRLPVRVVKVPPAGVVGRQVSVCCE